MKKWFTIWIVLLLVLTSMQAKTEPINLVITGETQGRLEALNNLGGLEARAAYFGEILGEATPTIVIDIGGFLPSNTEDPIDKASAHLYQQGMQQLKYDVRSVSQDDLMDSDLLLAANGEGNTGFLTSNLSFEQQYVDESGVEFLAHQIVTVGELKLGVLAFPSLQETLAIGDHFKIMHTNDSLDRLVKALRNEESVDVVLLIIGQTPPHVLTWLNQYEGDKPDLIITKNMDIGRQELDGLWMTNAPGTGNAVSKAVLEIDAEQGIQEMTYERILLNTDEYYDSDMRDFLDERYEEKATEMNLLASEPYPLMEFEAEQGYTSGYTGAERCLECHEDQYNQWLETEHATCFEDLIKTNRHWVPTIVQYYVTGYQHDVGYKGFSASPELRHVQCETCHGPGQMHVDEFGTGEIRRGTEIEMCMQCHTTERDPDFEDKFDLFLKKVEH